MKRELLPLVTPFEREMKEIPWAEYPRPMLKRDSYFCLNGKWELKILRKGQEVFDGSILVPFPVESRLSGVERAVEKDDVLKYERVFALPEGFGEDRVLLHFGAVDQFCTVYLNGTEVGKNVGGYIPFEFDVTDFLLTGENRLSVEVTDPLCKELPYGKQSEAPGGMWYTPVSGIWQTVWLESVPREYISALKITPDLTSVKIEVFGGEEEKTLIYDGKTVSFKGNEVVLTPEDPRLWSPDDPYLYDFEILCGRDRVRSYFALRTVEVRGEDILFNGKPTFFHGLLDQGYFSDGIYLPATARGFENDVLTMKKMGFNMLRKHIKVEPEIFYYYCDKYGMFVFQDFVNSGKYSFFIDTALPTVGLKRGVSHRATPYRRENFEKTAEATVSLLHNHPCVVYYTVFNEGWGQYDGDGTYEKFKKIDPRRVWDATSGWFREKKSDVLSEHVYFKPLKLKSDGRPLVLSEFGGYSLKIEGHSANTKQTYGYRLFTDGEKFFAELEKLYLEQVADSISHGLCAAVLTQVSDVEDETNGLFTYDRQVLKVDAEKLRAVSEKIYALFRKYRQEKHQK